VQISLEISPPFQPFAKKFDKLAIQKNFSLVLQKFPNLLDEGLSKIPIRRDLKRSKIQDKPSWKKVQTNLVFISKIQENIPGGVK